jgi:phage terminase large subunit
VHPRCQHVIDELTLYCYETDKLTGQILPKPEDKHNHMIDALRYACEGVRKAVRVPVNAPRVAESDYAYFS